METKGRLRETKNFLKTKGLWLKPNQTCRLCDDENGSWKHILKYTSQKEILVFILGTARSLSRQQFLRRHYRGTIEGYKRNTTIIILIIPVRRIRMKNLILI